MSNVSLAKQHRFSRKLVGHTIALASWLAIILSGLVIVVGVTTYTYLTFPSTMGYIAYVYWLVGAAIGLLLAVLTESLTLGSCARLRHILETRKEITRQYAKIPDPTSDVLTAKHAEVAASNFSMYTSYVFIGLGTAISTIAATLLWHMLLSPIGLYQSWLYSTLFSAIVSLTLLVSELAKELNTAVIAESIHADNFVQQAIKEDAKEKVLDQLQKTHDTRVSEAMSTETVQNEIETHAIGMISETLTGNEEAIPILISREKELKRQTIAANRQRTANQLQLIKGSNGVSLPNTGKLPIPPSVRRDSSRNSSLVVGLLETLGEGYVKDNITAIAQQHGLSPRTIYRHIEEAKKVNTSIAASK